MQASPHLPLLHFSFASTFFCFCQIFFFSFLLPSQRFLLHFLKFHADSTCSAQFFNYQGRTKFDQSLLRSAQNRQNTEAFMIPYSKTAWDPIQTTTTSDA